jgi:histone H3/H4
MSEIKETEWKRLSLKAGVPRMHFSCYDILQEISDEFLKSVIEKSIVVLEYLNKRTLDIDSISYALKNMGSKTFYTPGNYKKCKVGNTRKISTLINNYQKTFDCFVTSKAGFKRTLDLITKKRITEQGINLLHFAFENYIIHILELALKFMNHANRKTLEWDDIELVVHTKQSLCT